MATIVLGGVTLSSHMVWSDEIGSDQSVAQTHKRTLGGSSVVLSQQLFKGRPITLLATVDQGWLTKQQVIDVDTLATQSGLVMVLAIGSTNYNVMFRHEDAPAFTAEALDQVGALAPAGYYTATIKLITV